MIRKTSTAAFCAAIVALPTLATAETVAVWFYSGPTLTQVQRDIGPVEPSAEAAVHALVAGPTGEEQAGGIVSAIPAGTVPVHVALKGDAIEVDLSQEVLAGLDEYRLLQIFDQFRATLNDFPSILSIRLMTLGNLLSTYLPPPPVIEPGFAAESRVPMDAAAGALSGRKITIGPSHGRYWNGSGWYWQRTDPCGYGEALLEDTNSIRLMQFLYQYLTQDGAIVTVPRTLNESTCCHSETTLPWWKMAARYWLQHQGLPASIWDSSDTHYNDDIRARPLYADYVGADIYIAHHTNAGGGGTARGTETYRDSTMTYSAHRIPSLNLANAVHNSMITHIRNTYESCWVSRGVKDSAGGFGEIRIPNRPAILIELAFHDGCNPTSLTCSGNPIIYKDTDALVDDFFRSVSQWAIYKGICDYFGVVPGWDKYSSEYVSDTIPDTMNIGQPYNVSVTFRNRGVLWNSAHGFRLGAVGDADPFTTNLRVDMIGDIGPGQTHTFYFQMTPRVSGNQVSDWRMVREGVQWFGETLTKNIYVIGLPPDFNDDMHVDQTDVLYFRGCMTGQGNGPPIPECAKADLDEDTDVDQEDFGLLQRCITGTALIDFSCWTP